MVSTTLSVKSCFAAVDTQEQCASLPASGVILPSSNAGLLWHAPNVRGNVATVTLDRAGALEAERDLCVIYLHSLSDEEWEMPSLCEGWTVKDVVGHMGALSKGLFTPWVIGLVFSADLEEHNDRDVDKRRSWVPAKVLAEYEKWSKPAGKVLKALQMPGVGSVKLRMAEAGWYPGKFLASAITFDTGLHLRYDIASAIGREAPVRSADAIAVSSEWMVLGIPAMSAEQLTWLDRPVELQLRGVGGSTWTINPAGNKGRVSVHEGSTGSAAVTITGDAGTFPVWGTKRESWREHDVTVKSGDDELGAKFLDAVRII